MFAIEIENAMRKHARQSYPDECCGVVMNNEYIPLDNISPTPKSLFEIDSGEYLKLSRHSEIQAIIHSHTNGNASQVKPIFKVKLIVMCLGVLS